MAQSLICGRRHSVAKQRLNILPRNRSISLTPYPQIVLPPSASCKQASRLPPTGSGLEGLMCTCHPAPSLRQPAPELELGLLNSRPFSTAPSSLQQHFHLQRSCTTAMAKRAHDYAFAVAMPGAIAMDDDDFLLSPQSQLIDFAPGAATPTTSYFTTIKNMIPSVGTVSTFIANGLRRLLRTSTRPQAIRAEPVQRPDGARKKILIDAGLADAPATPTRIAKVANSKAVIAQNNKRFLTKQSESRLQFDCVNVPGAWPSPILSPLDSANGYDNPSPYVPPPPKLLTDYLPSYISPPPSPTKGPQDLFTREFNTVAAAQASAPSPRQSTSGDQVTRQQRLRANGLEAATKSGAPTTKNISPPLNNRIKTLRKNTTSNNKIVPSKHASSSISRKDTPAQAITTKPLENAQHYTITNNRANAKRANEEYRNKRAEWEAERFRQEKAEQKEKERKIYAKEYAVAYDQVVSSAPPLPTFSGEDLGSLPDAPYCEELSELPDAPPRKTVRLADQAHVKHFFQDDRICDGLDSFIVDVVLSPPQDVTLQNYLSLPQLQSLSTDGLSSIPTNTTTQQSPLPKEAASKQSATVGFTGVPQDIFFGSSDDEQSSLLEAEPSLDLIDGIRKGIEQGLAITTTKKDVDQQSDNVKPMKQTKGPQQSTKVPILPSLTVPQLAPLVPIQKPLVAPLCDKWKKELDAAVQKTDYGKISMDLVQHKLNTHDFGTILPDLFNGGSSWWLNDNVINEYLSILVDHIKTKQGYKHRRGGPAPPVHAFPSQWWINVNDDIKKVERWATKKQLGGKQLLDAKLLLFPICEGHHWRLLAIKPKERTIEYLDSLQKPSGQSTTSSRYISKAKEWLRMELGDSYNNAEWRVVQQRSQLQQNGDDCGVFTVLNALALLRDEQPDRVVSEKGMSDARRQMAVTLLLSKTIGELEFMLFIAFTVVNGLVWEGFCTGVWMGSMT
ncbi:uncharacterized protein BDR25DRAFT_392284 [Lindgomyces ingoldianus]|uniref:Uncharacterized protein n=1 Tax=Lindgomyces ingoldianus TaxID=673940 RepID=A0ACB6R3P5_9PLEO|nr:uncharacterized protein BDR25DRAFT_392284 [Lindgomyces ingoldianus]KAF2473878.1 hypothetical protein BDR25DRAFT_392284 [Lindgomyces ingoldianus]